MPKEKLDEENKAVALDAFHTIYTALFREKSNLRKVARIARLRAKASGSRSILASMRMARDIHTGSRNAEWQKSLPDRKTSKARTEV